MLIVEGSDLTGKTTLCRNLVKMLNAQGHPHIYRHLSRLPDAFNRYCGYEQASMTYSVQDRFHMSEPVYANMRGDETSLTPWLYRRVDAMLLLKGAFTVVMYAMEEQLIKDRWREGEMYDLEGVLQVNASFDRIANHGRWQSYDMEVNYRIPLSTRNQDPMAENVLAAYLAHMVTHRRLQQDRRLYD